MTRIALRWFLMLGLALGLTLTPFSLSASNRERLVVSGALFLPGSQGNAQARVYAVDPARPPCQTVFAAPIDSDILDLSADGASWPFDPPVDAAESSSSS